MNGITYFRLNSPYDGDVTKNCALSGLEVDNNFYTLEGRDIKSVELQDGKIVVNLMNGNVLTTENIIQDCVTDIEFDETNGILRITQNGVVKEIHGFITNQNLCVDESNNDNNNNTIPICSNSVLVDGSLIGNGLVKTPIGISPISKTGQYRPVNKIINMLEEETLPSRCNLFPGDRFLTIENVNEYGFLYNYNGLKKIACRLRETNSEWRIPTKEDWDDLLDSIEPFESFRNHTDVRSNKYLGKLAGKYLKSKEYWKKEQPCDCNNENDTCIDYSDETLCGNECACGKSIPCHPSYCGEYGTCHHKHYCDNGGIDKYGFNILPAGYANEAKDYMYWKERAYFWTASNHEYRDAYVKTFLYNKSCVLQDIMATDNFMSVRLVKNFDANNYYEVEDILGNQYPTVMMPSLKHGRTIWTSLNLCMGGCNCDCECGCHYILPNNGNGIEYTKKYFINEWTGRKWIRNELKDGESVVVINSSNGSTNDNYAEYRVVDGELVNVATLVYNSIIETVTPITENLETLIQGLDEKINNEIERSTNKDEEHDLAINALQERLSADEENIENNTNKIQELEEHIQETDTNVASLREELENAVNDITTAINEEREIRAEKDEELRNEILAEQEARIQKDEELEEKIEDEATERLAEDTRIHEEITTLEEITQEGITNLDEKIEQEIENRILSDEELEGQILVQEGSQFSNEDGILTLKSKSGQNDILVQFNPNFGTF